MKINMREQNGVTIFEIDGRIDSDGATLLDDRMRQAIRDGKSKIVMDMTLVQYINSAALRTLADVVSQNRASGGDLRLAALPPKVRRVLQIIGFDHILSIFETVDEAVHSY